MLVKSPKENFISSSNDRIRYSQVGGLAVIIFLVTLLLLDRFAFDPVNAALCVLTCVSFVLIVIEVGVNRVHLRSTAGLSACNHWGSNALKRCLLKVLGFLATIATVSFIYWLIPEYDKDLYQPAFALLKLLLPWILILMPPYIFWVDSRMDTPEDMYYKLGAWLSLLRPQISTSEWKSFALGWGVKAFFLPIMLGFLCLNVDNVLTHGFQFDSFRNFFITSMNLIFTLDTTFGAIGYLLTLRALDAHIRMPDQTVSGWLITLICYPPFFTLMGQSFYHFTAEQDWQVLLIGYPFAYVAWGTTILCSLVIYVWATVCFGCRFSNLTNRGIINFGPYRFMKHPAYVFKCISWWLLLTPFMSSSSPALCIQASLLLTLKCFVYFGRAIAEERLLMQDPAYVEYAAWIDQNGWWAQIKNVVRNRRQRAARQS